MTRLLNHINNLNDMVLQGNAMEAFEKYYAENVIMQENNDLPVVGKQANRERELDFFNQITDFRGARPLQVAVGENLTMVVWHFDYTHKAWGEKNYTQVAVQEWDGDQIIKETFYYAS
jgi:hypothetical protein